MMDSRETASVVFGNSGAIALGERTRTFSWATYRRHIVAAARFVYHLVAGPF